MIENVIFDLCGPILTIDIRRIDVALHRLGVLAEEPYLQLYRQGLTKRFESGMMTTEAFCDEARAALDFTASDEAICQAWNSLVVDVNVARLKDIARLHLSHRTFLLSNSDEVNAHYFSNLLEKEVGGDLHQTLFHELYYSYTLGLRKPDPAIFRRVLDSNGLKAEETLLVDDCKKHCLGAEEVGIRVLYVG